MKLNKILIFFIAIVFLIAAVFFMSDDIFSPYLSFSQAKKEAGKYVQIIGSLDKEKKIIHKENGYNFSMIDKDKSKMDVLHADIKPLNFEHAEQIVVLGRYQKENKIFIADKVLVKCPSKYKKTLNKQ